MYVIRILSATNNLPSLIEDWKVNVVDPMISSNDTDRLAESALHLSRILAYPNLDVNGTLKRLDELGVELNNQ